MKEMTQRYQMMLSAKDGNTRIPVFDYAFCIWWEWKSLVHTISLELIEKGFQCQRKETLSLSDFVGKSL